MGPLPGQASRWPPRTASISGAVPVPGPLLTLRRSGQCANNQQTHEPPRPSAPQLSWAGGRCGSGLCNVGEGGPQGDRPSGIPRVHSCCRETCPPSSPGSTQLQQWAGPYPGTDAHKPRAQTSPGGGPCPHLPFTPPAAQRLPALLASAGWSPPPCLGPRGQLPMHADATSPAKASGGRAIRWPAATHAGARAAERRRPHPPAARPRFGVGF